MQRQFVCTLRWCADEFTMLENSSIMRHVKGSAFKYAGSRDMPQKEMK